MRLAVYRAGVGVVIEDAPEPEPDTGDFLVQTEACALCSGELMPWYMERKSPHVLGHEVAGRCLASDGSGYSPGDRVAPHHHANCGECEDCRRGAEVHCSRWKATRLIPGGMAERFVIPRENLSDTGLMNDVRPQDAALVEPVACVLKSICRAGEFESATVVGLGSFGVLHSVLLMEAGANVEAIEPNPQRRRWAEELGIRSVVAPSRQSEAVFVCPGNEPALRVGLNSLRPGGTLVLFAPHEPGGLVAMDFEDLYFRDIALAFSYSAGRTEMAQAREAIRRGAVRAEQVVSHFISLDELPGAYRAMQAGDILKPMVMF